MNKLDFIFFIFIKFSKYLDTKKESTSNKRYSNREIIKKAQNQVSACIVT